MSFNDFAFNDHIAGAIKRCGFTIPTPIQQQALGAVLARRELRIFLEEWLRRIPEFRLRPGTRPVLATGMVNGILRLDLVWP